MKTFSAIAALVLALGLTGTAHATGIVFACTSDAGVAVKVESLSNGLKISPGSDLFLMDRSTAKIRGAGTADSPTTLFAYSTMPWVVYNFSYWLDSNAQKPMGKLAVTTKNGHGQKIDTYACASDITWNPGAL